MCELQEESGQDDVHHYSDVHDMQAAFYCAHLLQESPDEQESQRNCAKPGTGNNIIVQAKIFTRSILLFQVNGLYHTLWFIARYLIFVNAAVNPVIYGLTNEQFRRAFMTTRLGKCLCSKKAVTLQHAEAEQRKENVLTINKINIFYVFMKGKLKKEQCETSVTKGDIYEPFKF